LLRIKPRGALKRSAGTQNLSQAGSSSAFLTHFWFLPVISIIGSPA
jgi:hypothetical protein